MLQYLILVSYKSTTDLLGFESYSKTENFKNMVQKYLGILHRNIGKDAGACIQHNADK